MTKKVDQWVNLPKKKRFVEDEIHSKERLSFLKLKVEFRKARMAHFKVRVAPKGRPARYGKRERRRNSKFHASEVCASQPRDQKVEA